MPFPFVSSLLRPFPTYCLLLLLGCTWLTACETEATTESPETDVPSATENSARDYYQLKTYHFDDVAQLATTEAYLRDAYLPAMNRLGHGPVGVFKTRPEHLDSTLTLTVLTAFQDLDQLADLNASLNDDAVYRSAGTDYIEAPHDTPPYQRIETSILRAFSDMPNMATPSLAGPREDRIYEMRSYESATEADYWNKVKMFNEGGEVALFDSLAFNAVFYGEVIAGSNMPNLVYMTTHDNQVARDANWEAFVSAPQWKSLIADEQYKNNVSKNTQYFLYPTAYSDY